MALDLRNRPCSVYVQATAVSQKGLANTSCWSITFKSKYSAGQLDRSKRG